MSYQQIDLFSNIYPYFKLKGEYKVIELFGGIGSQLKALKLLEQAQEENKQFTIKHHKLCEWAYNSYVMYNLIHTKDFTDYSKDKTKEEMIERIKGTSTDYNTPLTLEQLNRKPIQWIRNAYNSCIATHNLVDICNVKGRDLDFEDNEQVIMSYSFPCFTRDTLVFTDNGNKPIEDVNVGDYVLSHDREYHKVVNKFDNGIHEIYKINAMGIDELLTTENHKFYIRTMKRVGHKNLRTFSEPYWKPTCELTKKDYLGIAITKNEIVPEYSKSFYWLIGRYMGDGWTRTSGGIIICCAKNELDEITPYLKEEKLKYSVVEERNIYKIHIGKKSLSEYVSQFGKGAMNKHLTKEIIDLPIDYLEMFIKGYLSADGCKVGKTYKISSVSKQLIYDVAQCIAKVYKTPYRIYKVNVEETKVIEDRVVNQNGWYQLVFKIETDKQDKAFYENGYIWYPIKSIEYDKKDRVYDIEVEESHSFLANNTMVHNCQDLSLAGKMLGADETSGTRSSLLYQVVRILREREREHLPLPTILFMENVSALINQKNIHNMQKVEQEFARMGYHNYIQVLNTKNYGLPQNRERVFMISLLPNAIYEFPPEMELKHKLKDLLSKNVDEKYYLDNDTIERISNWNAYEKPLENAVDVTERERKRV